MSTARSMILNHSGELAAILKAVAAHYCLNVESMRGTSKKAHFVEARAAFAWLANDAGYIPRGDTDQLSMFESPDYTKCRVCSL